MTIKFDKYGHEKLVRDEQETIKTAELFLGKLSKRQSPFDGFSAENLEKAQQMLQAEIRAARNKLADLTGEIESDKAEKLHETNMKMLTARATDHREGASYNISEMEKQGNRSWLLYLKQTVNAWRELRAQHSW